MISLVFSLLLGASQTAAAAAEAAPPSRAELCAAHIEAFIAAEAKASGMVAGPSWFVRSWWMMRLPEDGEPGALSDEERKTLISSLTAREASDPEAFKNERGGCIQEAIDAGAVPGMGPG